MIKMLTQQEHRINRNIVECKCSLRYLSSGPLGELIETLWNVNLVIALNRNFEAYELIETLWNVNANIP